MKKLAIYLCLSILPSINFAQGINFSEKNWKEIKAQAKKENKYIMLDLQTTWCGICRHMEKETFPVKEVGDFFNKNYICVSLQLDTGKNDNQLVKSRYAWARNALKEFKPDGYPTFIYLSPDGKPVHRVFGGGPVADFIQFGKDALDTNKQFYTLLNKYKSKQRTPEVLYELTKDYNQQLNFPMAMQLCDEYLKTQKNPFTKKNLELVMMTVYNADGPGYKLINDNQARFDAVMGKGEAETFLKQIREQSKK